MALDTDPAIRAAATAPLSSGLQEGFAAADELLNTVLSPEHATLAFIGAGGYRQWVAGPEAAVRRLVADSLQLFQAPTVAAAGGIKAALQAAADAAAASLPADLPEHLCDRLAQLAADSIASWQAGALGQLHLLLQSEQACPENESFAELQRQLNLLLSTPPDEEHEEPGECRLLRARCLLSSLAVPPRFCTCRPPIRVLSRCPCSCGSGQASCSGSHPSCSGQAG